MNLRKPALRWTYEDQQIWRSSGMMNNALYDCWTEGDRRDADLMYAVQAHLSLRRELGFMRISLMYRGIDVCGWPQQ
jgi:hypothetical protein